MGLEVNVIARTFEVDTEGKPVDTDLFTLGGKMAGICYMPDSYFEKEIQDVEKSVNRANNTCKSGHHSVFEHGSISFQISGLPKIMVMMLNSTEQYTTSEKSARYTVMKPDTELEKQTYEKWISKLEKKINEVYPEIDSKSARKLAMENARYLISVFTPTHMVWTTNYRQVAYVIGWLGITKDRCNNIGGDFNSKLADWCEQLQKALMNVTSSYEQIKDNKNRTFEFTRFQSTNTHVENKEIIGDVYQLVYDASFAQLAQLHRHRTIHYEFDFSGVNAEEVNVYIPKIIENDDVLKDEWIKDSKEVAYCYPQGTLVKVVEQGRAIKFFEKCKERLCGRAQLEIMLNEKEQMQKFIDNRGNLSTATAIALDNVTDGLKVCTKCKMNNIVCTEGCMWGSNGSLDRLI